MKSAFNTVFNQRGSLVVLIEAFFRGDGRRLLSWLECLLLVLIEREVCLLKVGALVTLLPLSRGIDNLLSVKNNIS